MYKAYTLTHMLFFEQKLFPDFFCKYRLSLNRIFVCNETFTIYAQDITDYEYLKNIFEYYSDFENWPRISVTFFLDHSVYMANNNNFTTLILTPCGFVCWSIISSAENGVGNWRCALFKQIRSM